MNSPLSYKTLKPFSNSIAFKCLVLVGIVLFYKALFLSSSPRNVLLSRPRHTSDSSSPGGVRTDKFLEVPQIVWGLNNQKIAFARACLTARTMNRTLLMPSLSASLFYKEVDKLLPIPFDKVFQFERFNSLCSGFVRLARFSDIRNRTQVFDLEKGSGRRWTVERDMEQLRESVSMDEFEVIRVKGKNPFLWHDHWPVKDYAKVFECMVVVDEISREADKVVMKIREAGENAARGHGPVPFVAVHMRIEIDWMIHCKKLEQRQKVSEICSSKREIMERVGNISGLKTPTVLYLAVADSLLEEKEEESSVLKGWRDGLIPFEKKKLGVKEEVYSKYSYLIQSAIDYEVCLRADVFVGNSFSTFSSLIVLERTQKARRLGFMSSCEDGGNMWSSYAYNLAGESLGVPRRWMTNMTHSSLQAISYGSNSVSCSSE
ncbi:O-fucosyltransferase 23 [Hirschfeldia incana]|nr:O-fucosyltransferase 23 [Hirschfeldia incana]KAJ0234270.1 O-fucosyltransferase 23 [Hirschfeldia incana]KAJ0234271.1 O-fucosyltransferase 23 [Hirschfeldia incana]